ncbi:SUMF1/EgtB/PvdO family nonheme iron enzyme, partial [Thiohalobacter sp.]|uniref:SUMF1/EgtB/PvdO family nonheme iron enzyme n=1 Tax=Thiohalobacter sp. TaxID=2025948 RepID=UPI00262EC667
RNEALGRRLEALEADKGKVETALADARGDLEATRERFETRVAKLEQALAGEREARAAEAERFAAVEREHAETVAALEAARQETASLGEARETLAHQLEEARTALEQSGQAMQAREAALTTELNEVRAQLVEARDALSKGEDSSGALRAQFEQESERLQGRIAELEAAMETARAELAEKAGAVDALGRERDTLQARTDELEQRLQTLEGEAAEVLKARESLEAELAQARAEAAEAGPLRARIGELESALAAAEARIAEANAGAGAAEEVIAERDRLAAELDAVREAALARERALEAELAQLREATTADLEAMQDRVAELERALAEGGGDAEETERLRLLLNEARDEAAAYRAELERLQQQAQAPAADNDGSDLIRLQAELELIRERVNEAVQGRDAALDEAAQLREQLAARQAAPAPVAMPAEEVPAAPGRGGLVFGLLGGLLLGAAVAGGFLWYQQQQAVPVAPSPAPSAAESPAVAETKPAATPKAAPAKPKRATVRPSLPPLEAPKPGRSFRDRASSDPALPMPEMIEIRGGEFEMGSGSNSLEFDERPRHKVKVPDFAMGRYEVTFEEYDAFARATGRKLPADEGWGRGQRPVINVTWDDAVAYTRWLSEQTGHVYRLPTEAEWEYAAGRGARTLYWWGNSLGENRANCFNCGSVWDASKTAPVGSFDANDFGLHDVSGNVSEWIQDCYHPSYEGAPDDGSAWLEAGCSRRVVRGGGFNSPANTLRLTKRGQQHAGTRLSDLGFRVVRER